MNNTVFNNCNFENCNITINNTSSESSSVGGGVASLAILGGVALAFNPAILSTVIGISLLGFKGLCLSGLGYSTIKTLTTSKDSQNKIEERKQDYIETTFRVKELE